MGRPQAISTVDEERLVEGLIYFANYGFGFTNQLILDAVQNFVANNPDKYSDFKGGWDWLYGFKRRWSDKLTQRVAISPCQDLQSVASEESESEGEIMEIDQEQLKIKAPLNNKKKCFKCSVNFDGRKKGAKDWLSC